MEFSHHSLIAAIAAWLTVIRGICSLVPWEFREWKKVSVQPYNQNQSSVLWRSSMRSRTVHECKFLSCRRYSDFPSTPKLAQNEFKTGGITEKALPRCLCGIYLPCRSSPLKLTDVYRERLESKEHYPSSYLRARDSVDSWTCDTKKLFLQPHISLQRNV